ncbi:SRPBCC domain-containing protein [Microbulbifer aggregans]|uniref:SRPBCC domain-containing protein n=1 Tax=Microbulbifer aggregans TaxID=1769779 RepID=UPI001CFD0FA0|nr:SRPBCC domain-containing protein [Microbulbifer aggregans]
MNTQNAIEWPEKFLPGTTDNFVSNEMIVADLSVADVWPYLNTATAWPTYYSNSSDVDFDGGAGPELRNGVRFRFKTFGFPVESRVVEYIPPAAGAAARIAWHGWAEGDETTRLDVHHAWLLEDLPGGRLRILTQESQIGVPAREMATTRPNPMLNGHQEWLDGLLSAARDRASF